MGRSPRSVQPRGPAAAATKNSAAKLRIRWRLLSKQSACQSACRSGSFWSEDYTCSRYSPIPPSCSRADPRQQSSQSYGFESLTMLRPTMPQEKAARRASSSARSPSFTQPGWLDSPHKSPLALSLISAGSPKACKFTLRAGTSSQESGTRVELFPALDQSAARDLDSASTTLGNQLASQISPPIVIQSLFDAST